MSKLGNLDFYTCAEEARKQSLLNEAEIRDLLRKEERCKAMQIIVIRTLRLVCNYVFRWSSFARRYNIPLEDLFQTGSMAVILGVMSYSYKKGYFYRHITRIIRAYIMNEVFSNFGYPRRVCLQMMKKKRDINPADSLDIIVANSEEGEPLLLGDILPSPEDENAHLVLEVNHLLSDLRKDHKTAHKLSGDIIELRYSVGRRRYLNRPLSLAEVGRILSISKESVRMIELKTINHLRAL